MAVCYFFIAFLLIFITIIENFYKNHYGFFFKKEYDVVNAKEDYYRYGYYY